MTAPNRLPTLVGLLDVVLKNANFCSEAFNPPIEVPNVIFAPVRDYHRYDYPKCLQLMSRLSAP